jgi:putative CocE/NonD family hydrolase
MRATHASASFLWALIITGQPWVMAQVGVARYPVPAPRFETRIEKSVLVPMRDGVELSTDLFYPDGAAGKLPTILVRTPYNKNLGAAGSVRFVGHGYVVAIQDVRGKYESEGEFTVSGPDTEDGYDMMSWIVKQPWSNGKIGTYGCSYLGENQVETAKLRHPAHAAMIPQAASGSLQYFGALRGGAFELASSTDWFLTQGSKIRPVLSPNGNRDGFLAATKLYDLAVKRPTVDMRTALLGLPLVDLLKRMGAAPTEWEGFLTHEPLDPWWDHLGYIKPTHQFDTPALFIDSWYDYGPGDMLRLQDLVRRNSTSERSRSNVFAVLGPTTHCAYERGAAERTVVGTREVGDARFDFFGLYLRWFDHWLRDADNGVTTMPRFQLYVMGRNQWRGEAEWPLARTEWTKYYLRSAGRANGRLGDGTLSLTAPGREPADRFSYDPATPVPSLGGPDWGASNPDLLPGAMDQSGLEMRHDVLVYTTAPLERGVEITGPIRLKLFVSSDARDTDFTAKLVDVYPDGRAFNVQEGIQRARYREGFDRKVWLEPGKVFELEVGLEVTSNYFPAGHRIRLEVSSSNFPRFDRNLNTGGQNWNETTWKIATNSVHHDARYPSHLLLPVIPDAR